MAKHENKDVRTQPTQKIPAGHFETDGLSKGKQTGPVRKSPDASNADCPRPATK